MSNQEYNSTKGFGIFRDIGLVIFSYSTPDKRYIQTDTF